MNLPICVWQHKDAIGKTIGSIKRFIDQNGNKQDIPYYHPDKFKAGIPELFKKTGYPLFGLETFKNVSRVLIICEGQKAQSAFAGLGFQCVTSILGANNTSLSNWKEIEDANLIYLAPDNDASGEVYAKSVFHIIKSAKEIKVIRLPNLPEKGDICDWLKQQTELKNWNEFDSLAQHPSRNILRERLQKTIATSLHDVPTSWRDTVVNDFSSWPEPEPIQNVLLPVQTLSLHLVPDPYQEWIADVAERMQCPEDYLAVTAMVTTASLIGTSCGIKPKQNDDWLVIPNLWGGIIGRPGMLKTPAVSEVMQFISQLETEAKKIFEASLASYQADVEFFKAEKEALKGAMLNSRKQFIKNKLSDMTDDPILLKKQFMDLKEPQKPIWKRCKTNDTTIEKLSELLVDNPRGLLLYRDELIGLLASWDKEGHESDRAFFLEAWNGYGSLTTDRIGRGTVYTENLCISIFGNTQPAKLSRYLHHAMCGLDNDGLLQRFQLLIYPDEPKEWQLIDRVPNHQAKKRTFNVMKKIAEMDFKQIGASKEPHDRFAYFRFDDQAQKIFYDWLTELECKKLRSDDHLILLEHLSKYRSLMPSLALIFHLIEIADGKMSNQISALSADRAVFWCEYLESHARRIYGTAVNVNHQAVAKLAKKIEEGVLSNSFTLRDIYRKEWGMLDTKEVVQKACTELVEAGWLRQEFSFEGGRAKQSVYFINPKIKHNIKKIPGNSHLIN